MALILTVQTPSGTSDIRFEAGTFSVTGGTLGQQYRLTRQLQQWWREGIVATVPGDSKNKKIVIEQSVIKSDHPRFIDSVIRRLRMLFGSTNVSVQTEVNEETRVNQQLELALRNMDDVAVLQQATAEVRKVLPKLSLERKKELASILMPS